MDSSPHKMLPDSVFRQIVQFTPLISIDLILEDENGRILVGKRNNEPARGFYFVPGGRILKTETRAACFTRLLASEVGQAGDIADARFLGVYEHHYDTNRFEDSAYGTHYLVLGYAYKLVAGAVIELDNQHSDIRWLTPAEILAADDVHKNTKVYFRGDY